MKEQRKRLEKKDCTPGQLRCWKAWSWCVGGDHHMEKVYECGHGIRTTTYGSCSTHDGNLMTRMVLIAHLDCVRLDVDNGGPNRIAVIIHPRDPEATGTCEGHPNLDALIERAKAMQSWPKDAMNGEKKAPGE